MSIYWRYGLELAAGLALVLIIGNLGSDPELDTFPWMISILAFPVVAYRLLAELQIEFSRLEYVFVLTESEAVVRRAAVAFGLFEFAYAWVFYGGGFELWPVFFTLPVTVIVTWLIGMVVFAAVAWYVLRPGHVTMPDWLADFLSYEKPASYDEEWDPFDR